MHYEPLIGAASYILPCLSFAAFMPRDALVSYSDSLKATPPSQEFNMLRASLGLSKGTIWPAPVSLRCYI